MELTHAEHGKLIATAIRLAGRNGKRGESPVLIELTNKGVFTHGGKARQTYVRFNANVQLPDTSIILNGRVVRDILQLSKRVEITANGNEVTFQNGCTWNLTNRANPRAVKFVGYNFTKTEPIREIARIPFDNLRQAIKAGYKRAYKPSDAVIVVGGQYELSCRDLETFLKVKEVKIHGDDMKLSVYLCEDNTLRYGIPGVWVATMARTRYPLSYRRDRHGRRLLYSYWTKTYSTWQGHETIQDAWRDIRRIINNLRDLEITNYEGSITLLSFFGFEKTWGK